MKEKIFILFIAFPFSAWAELERVAISERAILAIDMTTLKKINGEMRRAWSVTNLDDPFPHPTNLKTVKSLRTLTIYDCKRRRIKVLTVSGHSGLGATGEKISSFNPAPKWEQLAEPDDYSFNSQALFHVCFR